MSLTKLSLGRNHEIIPAQGDDCMGTGISRNFFCGVHVGCLRHFAFSKFRIFRMFFWVSYVIRKWPQFREIIRNFSCHFSMQIYTKFRIFREILWLFIPIFQRFITDDIFYTQQRNFELFSPSPACRIDCSSVFTALATVGLSSSLICSFRKYSFESYILKVTFIHVLLVTVASSCFIISEWNPLVYLVPIFRFTLIKKLFYRCKSPSALSVV
jgi:hypothetical protein